MSNLSFQTASLLMLCIIVLVTLQDKDGNEAPSSDEEGDGEEGGGGEGDSQAVNGNSSKVSSFIARNVKGARY